MCKCGKMGKTSAVSHFDLADPKTVALMVIGAAGANAVVNPIMNAIWKPGSGKVAPKIAKPLMKGILGYLLIMKSNNEELEAIGAGAMIAGATEAVVGVLPDSMKLQLGLDSASVGAAEIYNLDFPLPSYSHQQSINGASSVSGSSVL